MEATDREYERHVVGESELAAEGSTRGSRDRRGHLDAVVDDVTSRATEQLQVLALVQVRTADADPRSRTRAQPALDAQERGLPYTRAGLVHVDAVHGVDDALARSRIGEPSERRGSPAVRVHDVWGEVVDGGSQGTRVRRRVAR